MKSEIARDSSRSSVQHLYSLCIEFNTGNHSMISQRAQKLYPSNVLYLPLLGKKQLQGHSWCHSL